MSAKRPVRSPFVVTLAAAAALLTPGCGARVDGGAGPGPVDPQPECPATTPVHGSTCSGELSCNYADTFCGSSAGTTAFCESGKWSVASATCNPPPPDCPYEEPTAGSACGYWGGRDCTYPDRCRSGFDSKNSYVCEDGKWAVRLGHAYAWCPPTQPVDGTSCADCAAHITGSCVYEYCGSTPSRESSCDPITRTWRSLALSCNPPPPDAGPDYDAPWGEDAGTPPEPAP